MSLIALRAHFDGDKIVLDEPYELEPDTRLIVTVLSKDSDQEREDWANLAMQGLARAYSDDEPEYTPDLIKEVNSEYKGR
jgi:hypothetical protein